MTKIERMIHPAESLVQLLKDPEPGCFTWQEAVQRQIQTINNINDEEPSND